MLELLDLEVANWPLLLTRSFRSKLSIFMVLEEYLLLLDREELSHFVDQELRDIETHQVLAELSRVD